MKFRGFVFVVGWLGCWLSGGAGAATLTTTGTGPDVQVQFSANNWAAIQPMPTELWLVTKERELALDDNALRVATGAQEIELLDVPAGSGVRLVFPRERLWQATSEQQTLMLKRGVPAAERGIIALRETLMPPVPVVAVVDVVSRASLQRMRVGLVQQVAPVPEAVLLSYGELLPTATGIALADGDDLAVEGEVLAVIPSPLPVPEITVASADLTVPSPVLLQQQQEEVLPESAASVRAVRATVPVSLTDVHDPTQAVPFTLPEEYIARRLGLTTQLNPRQQQFARAFGAVSEALQRVDTLETELAARDKAAMPPKAELDGQMEDTLPVEEAPSSATVVAAQAEQQPAIRQQEIFLRRLGLRDQGFYRTQEGLKLRALLNAQTEDEKLGAALDLARIYMAFERYDQAEGVVRNLPVTEDGMPKNMLARTLLGAALVMQEHGQEALNVLETVEGHEPHRSLWLGAAQVLTGRYDAAANNFDGMMREVSFYPEHIGFRLKLLEGKALLETQQYARLFDRMDTLGVEQENGELPPLAAYYVARAQLELGATDDGRRVLAQVAESGSGKTAIQAKIDFVLDMARTKDLLTPQVIMFLEDLRFIWRGDELEGKVLKELGRRYIAQKNFRLGLNRLKTYAVAFPEAPDIVEITELMRQAFSDVFAPENRYMLDDLGILGMYYDFRELTPADIRGDRVVENIGDVLNDVVLYERAIDLFERQLAYRVTDPVKQAALGVELAALYRKNNQPEEALTALDKWGADKTLPPLVRRAYALERGRVLLMLGDYAAARELVAEWLDDVARQVQVDIAWQAEDYQTVARLLTQMFDTNEHPGFDDVRLQTDFIRLSYALVQLNQKEALAQLVANYKESLREYPAVTDIVNVYATKARLHKEDLIFVSGRPLQKIAKQLLSLNSFEDDYNNLLATLAERRRLREIYNQKQDYMDYLRENGLI